MAGLTPWDTFFVVMAIIEVICIAAMGYVASMMMQTARKGQRRVQPLVREALGLQQLGQAMVSQAKSQGGAVVTRVKTVAALVKRRVDTTRRIAGEVLPPARQAATEAKEVQVDLSRKAQVLGDMARRLGRVKTAAESAVAAAREEEPRETAGVG